MNDNQYCSECGSRLPTEVRFCESCGVAVDTPVDAKPEPESRTTQSTPNSRLSDRTAAPGLGKVLKSIPLSRRAKAGLAVFIVAGAGVAAFFAIYDFDRKKIEKAAQQTISITFKGDESKADLRLEKRGVELVGEGVVSDKEPLLFSSLIFIDSNVQVADLKITERSMGSAKVKAEATYDVLVKQTDALQVLASEGERVSRKRNVTVSVVKSDDGQWETTRLSMGSASPLKAAREGSPSDAGLEQGGALAAKAVQEAFTFDEDIDAYNEAQQQFYATVGDTASNEEESIYVPEPPTLDDTEWDYYSESGTIMHVINTVPDCYLDNLTAVSASDPSAKASSGSVSDDGIFQRIVVEGRFDAEASDYEDCESGGRKQTIGFTYKAEMIRSALKLNSKWYVGRLTVLAVGSDGAIDLYDARELFTKD